MAQFGIFHAYQTLHEEEALEIALRESLDLFHTTQEEDDLAFAIQLSLVSEKGEQKDCGETDSGSEAGTVHCDPFDYDDGNQGNVSFGQRTLVQESEDKDGVEFSLTVDDESSDDGQEQKGDERETSFEIDIWKEFREMSVASSQATLAYDTTTPDYLEITPRVVKGAQNCNVVRGSDHTPNGLQHDSENIPTSQHRLQVEISDYSDHDHIKRFTLQNNVVTIPELGMFKRKEPFACLANIQVIQNMLSQISGEQENAESTMRYPLHSRETNTIQSYHPALASHDLYKPSHAFNTRYTAIASTSKSPFEGTEDERRSRLYDSLVRAQRRYAEKLSSPSGPTGYFTKEEWDSLGDGLDVQDWEGGFLSEENDVYRRKSASKNVGRKENMSVSSWKGKEKCVVEAASDGEEEVTLRMKF